MTKNIEKLSDAAEVTIRCDYCKEKIGGNGILDCYDLAEEADQQGWEVNGSEKVKCPSCVKKMKRS